MILRPIQILEQYLGGIAIGTFHPGTGEYTISWTATLTQGAAAGMDATFIFSGTAQVEPAALSK